MYPGSGNPRMTDANIFPQEVLSSHHSALENGLRRQGYLVRKAHKDLITEVFYVMFFSNDLLASGLKRC